MNGFSTVSGGYVTQLISSHSSTISASSQAALFSRVEFTQLYASDARFLKRKVVVFQNSVILDRIYPNIPV